MTLGNLLAGCLGIYTVMSGHLLEAVYFLWIGALLDFLDGFAARLLKSASQVGKQLDSLSDIVTFGVLPSFLLLHMVQFFQPGPISFLAFFPALMAALRLAKFNVDKEQAFHFSGLPTPSFGLFVSGLVFIFIDRDGWLITSPHVLLGIGGLMGFLMVSNLPLMSLKIKRWGWIGNESKIALVFISVLLLYFFGFKAFAAIILVYIVLSLFEKLKVGA